MFDLTGDVAVVTGGGTGLGRQFALALARQGANVAVLGRRQEKLDAVVEELKAIGVDAIGISTDVKDVNQIIAARDKVVEKFGKVTILVNNAGGGAGYPIEAYDEEKWNHDVSVDLTGVFLCMKYFGQNMLKNGYGRIINIASILGKGGLPELPILSYCSCKGAVINLTRHAAAEWCQRGITVNAICPGFFPSEANSPEAMEAMNGFITARTPMGRPGIPGELDSTVVYLAAHESTYVTGSICTCDGGWTAV